jgi:hypothetical protein
VRGARVREAARRGRAGTCQLRYSFAARRRNQCGWSQQVGAVGRRVPSEVGAEGLYGVGRLKLKARPCAEWAGPRRGAPSSWLFFYGVLRWVL